jgi:hypothetical protein
MTGILDFFQPPGHPSLFKNEPDVTVKLLKAVIPRRYIKSDVGLKFAQTYRTKRKWSRITFLQVIGAVYHTFKVDTMCQRKHQHCRMNIIRSGNPNFLSSFSAKIAQGYEVKFLNAQIYPDF